jgi:hypothetical protein
LAALLSGKSWTAEAPSLWKVLLVVADLAQSDILQLCDLFRSAHPTKPIVIAAGSTVGKPFTPLKIVLTQHPRGTQRRRVDISILIESEAFAAD